MTTHAWSKEFPAAITISDSNGIILDMNEQAAESFALEGGKKLIGTNVLDCHPEPARSKLEDMMRERRKNAYTIEKHGIKKMVYQAPWYENSEYRGFVEISFEIPFEMPHFLRKG